MGYTLFVVALWGGVFPALLAQEADGTGLPLRPWPLVVLGMALLFAGSVLVRFPAEELARRGIGLLLVRPGPVLVTDGWHGRIRNPMDVGVILIALASWTALDVGIMWVIPAAALVYYAVGIGPYEDRLLLEEFGDEFRDYRRRVRKWVPLTRPDRTQS
jgi:protein-S-isoprenylcysteine O-methyltransferase Ste14